MKGRALRRALATNDAIRVNANIPLIVDTTELITPSWAQDILTKHNRCNRPVSWARVDEYADMMAAGKWQLHPQGLVFDQENNLMTGQTRLWGVVRSGVSVYMRVSRGTLREAAMVMDRGRPQSARDLASRETEQKHSVAEASMARGICALAGNLRPSIDELAVAIRENQDKAQAVLAKTSGTKKTRVVVMILSTICAEAQDAASAGELAILTEDMAAQLEAALAPLTAAKCWNKGAAFALALEHARKVIRRSV
jgi:hypothetical protein